MLRLALIGRMSAQRWVQRRGSGGNSIERVGVCLYSPGVTVMSAAAPVKAAMCSIKGIMVLLLRAEPRWPYNQVGFEEERR